MPGGGLCLRNAMFAIGISSEGSTAAAFSGLTRTRTQKRDPRSNPPLRPGGSSNQLGRNGEHR